MWGGAMFNSTGNSCIGVGNVADSLNMIDQVCFKKKLATTREMYDALMNNWEGYEELRQRIVGQLPHFGNADPECDKYMTFAANTYADSINRCVNPRGTHYSAGCYPVTLNVMFGMMTGATPDGRKAGEPLADGISPVQGQDKKGPIATMQSLLTFDYTAYGNGTLCNMKFHPTSLAAKDGVKKLVSIMQSYFKQGGMELQLNIVSGDTLRAAQEHPENYRDLVVRIAGFSAYFVEVFKESQDDLIRRTEQAL
ncbi:MAG: glycyl radical protein, partial [Oscillospiraceae bacterium]|nr:glycyl radical protein [Oscillospiraceae bacterium]